MRIKLFPVALLIAASPAMAAPITDAWIAPGIGINAEKSKIIAPGTTLNGKTVQDAMTQIDANTTAVNSAQTTADLAIPLKQKDAVNGVPASTNSNLWTGMVSAIGTPTGGGFVASDLPVAYTTTSGGGVGAVAVVDAAQASQAVVWSAGVCPASTTVHLQINGTTYATADISGTTTQGQVLTLTPSGTVSVSDIPDSVSSFLSSDVENCTTTPQVYTYWTPTHATITSPGKGYTSLPTFVSAQSSVASLAQSTLSATSLQTAQTAPSLDALIGAPSGVAPLSIHGQVTYPVSSPTVAATGSTSVGEQPGVPLNLTYNGWKGDYPSHMAGPRVTVGLPINNMADQMAMFGGHRLYDSVFSKFYALPYGVGDQGGCVHSSVMTYAPNSGAGCGAGGWDAVDEYELASNNPPWYMAGAEMPDEDGVGHAVTFSLYGAYIRPALPASYKDYMHKGAHVMTNVVAGDTIYSGASLDGVQTHQNQDQRFYGGTVSDWTDGSDSAGTYTFINISGAWEPISGDAVTSGHVPSVGTASGVGTDALDQVQYSEFSQPVLMIGTYIKHFTRNTSCEVVIKDGTDGEGVKKFGPSRKCDEELDNWYHGPDYGATMHGLTIGTGFDNKVSNDSYGLGIASDWPVGIRDWLASDSYDFDGDMFVTGSRIGSPATIGAQKMMLQVFQEPTANIGYLEAMEMWSRTDSISQANNSTINGPAAVGEDISYWFVPRQSPTKYNLDGTFESAISFNPNWSKNGVALCGAQSAGYFGTSTEGTACLTVGTWGDVSTSGSVTAGNGLTVNGGTVLNGNTSINDGKSLTLSNSSATSNSYMYGGTDGAIHLAGTLNVGSLVIPFGTPASSSASCTQGQLEMDATYLYSCVSTNTWNRTANGATW